MNRNLIKKILTSPLCHITILLTVIINAIDIVYISDSSVKSSNNSFASSINVICLAIFLAELAMRFYVHKQEFFRNGWFVFDALIIFTCLLAYVPQLNFLYVFRILLLLRLCEFMPSLKILIESLIYSLQGICATLFLLAIIYFIYASLGTKFFGQYTPEYFGSFSLSLKTLLQVMVFDNLGDVVNSLLNYSVWIWIYILTFIFLTAFTFVNLIVAVLVESIDYTSKMAHRKSVTNHHTYMEAEIVAIKKYFADMTKLDKK